MVYGQVGWLKHYLLAAGSAPEECDDIYRWLQKGNLQQAEAKILENPGGDITLLRPQTTDHFFPTLQSYISLNDEKRPPENWITLWDLSLVGHWNYYSGLVFTLYHNRSGQVLANGGRFDIKTPTQPFAGVGFTLYLDVWQEAVSGSRGYVDVS